MGGSASDVITKLISFAMLEVKQKESKHKTMQYL